MGDTVFKSTIKAELIRWWLELMRLRGGGAVEVEATGPHEWTVRTLDIGEATPRVIGPEIESATQREGRETVSNPSA